MQIYAAYHKNETVLEKSSSGGIFTALSDFILSENGIIIGGGYNCKTHRIEHSVCHNEKERDCIRGSKYIQSHISREVYQELSKYCSSGIKVLFVGTPCQVHAVKAFLKACLVDDSKLYTCDLLCHGVGSPGIWAGFINWIELLNHIRITEISFKDKRRGWMKPTAVASNGNREVSLRGYSRLYFSNNIMRPSCYHCGYASVDRVGDITLGDFWRIQNIYPDMYQPMGNSLVLVNSQKGEKLFNSVMNQLVYRRSSLEDAMQENLESPVAAGKDRNEIMNDYQYMSYPHFILKWSGRILFRKMISRYLKNG